ncbi:hypothetical protein JYT90_00120 [bacterium AH-315-P07]|nr:hypothetical protein [bacterium AH-315-P07]
MATLISVLSRGSRLLVLPLLFLSLASHSNDTDGNLDLILSPSEGLPAFQAPGSNLAVTLAEKGELWLIGVDEEIKLTPVWKRIHAKKIIARCPIPKGVQPGLYSLRLSTSSRSDTSISAVYIYRQSPEVLTLVCLPSADRTGLVQDPTTDLQIVIAPFNIDEDDDSTILESPFPVIRIPARGSEAAFEMKYGRLPYAVRIGQYSLIIFNVAETRADRIGQLYELLRSNIAQIWTVGITLRSPVDLPFQAQLTLFDDDPLHAVIGPLPGEDLARLEPWKRTQFIPYPPVKTEPIAVRISRNSITVAP